MLYVFVDGNHVVDAQIGLRFVRGFADEAARWRQQLERIRGGSPDLPVDQETRILKFTNLDGYLYFLINTRGSFVTKNFTMATFYL